MMRTAQLYDALWRRESMASARTRRMALYDQCGLPRPGRMPSASVRVF